MRETNRYGEELETAQTEDVIKHLAELNADLVLAVCAALLVVHHPYNYKEVLNQITEKERK